MPCRRDLHHFSHNCAMLGQCITQIRRLENAHLLSLFFCMLAVHTSSGRYLQAAMRNSYCSKPIAVAIAHFRQ